MEREHFSSLSLTIFLSPVASPSSSSVCLVHVHNVMMECQNKKMKRNKQKQPDVVVAMMMGGQIHGGVWMGVLRPQIN